jgi:cytochrome c556
MIRKFLVVLLAAGLGAGAATSVHAQAKPEDQVKYRQATMTMSGRSVAALTAMVRGDVPFNATLAAQHARVIADVSDLPLLAGAWGPGTNVGTHKSDPKVWSEPEKFQIAYQTYVTAARALPAAAGEQKTLQAALGDLGRTCKGCHDSYRMK